MHDRLVKELSRLHTALFRMTGGGIGSRLVGNDMLLLTTRGRMSGRPHTVPLLFLTDDDAFVVIASYGGRPDHPEWYRNLETSPEASVQIGNEEIPVTAQTMDGGDRTEWWPRIVDAYGDYATYQARTTREIPVVRLYRREEGDGRTRPPCS